MLSFKIEFPHVNLENILLYFSEVFESSISVLNELRLTCPRGLLKKCTQGKQTISHMTLQPTQDIAETHKSGLSLLAGVLTLGIL